MKDKLRRTLNSFRSGTDWPELSMLRSEIDRELLRAQRATHNQSSVFREETLLRLHTFQSQIATLAIGRLSFDSTETWRTVYEQVLENCRVKRYSSIALVRSEDYWQDAPGQSSLEFNYKLIEHGFQIQRIFIIDEFFWPRHAVTPSKDIFGPIVVQSQRGIEVSLVRTTSLEEEPALCCDLGIYGEDAVGLQDTDSQGRTVRFELRFAPTDIRQAQQRWQQVALYATSINDMG